MNNKGFSIINFIVCLFVVGVIISSIFPKIIEYLEEKKIAQHLGTIGRNFNSTYKPEVSSTIVNACDVNCFEGKKTIEINGKVYHLGVVKNSWGDLESVDCQ